VKGAGGGIDGDELPTGAVYPEVRETLERPDRIRREAFQLLEKGELLRLENRRNLVFRADRQRDGHTQTVQVDVAGADRINAAGAVNSREAMAKIREEIFLKLVELLEADPAIQ
jgi:hypothetical protein